MSLFPKDNAKVVNKHMENTFFPVAKCITMQYGEIFLFNGEICGEKISRKGRNESFSLFLIQE